MKENVKISINKFGQDIVDIECLQSVFLQYNIDEKISFLNQLLFFKIQSKPKETDIIKAIENSNLKES